MTTTADNHHSHLPTTHQLDLGTVVVLSTVSYHLAINPTAYLTEIEVPPNAGLDNSIEAQAREKVPRIIHQTWKTDIFTRQVESRIGNMMPNYEHMLWMDEASHEFIALC